MADSSTTRWYRGMVIDNLVQDHIELHVALHLIQHNVDVLRQHLLHD